MASPSPLQHGKVKSKRRSKGLVDSPKSSKHAHQWVQLSSWCMVPAHKISTYHHLEEDVLEPPGSLRSTTLESLSGGLLVCNGRSKLYAHWTSLDKIDTSEHLPLRSDSILLHPETMRICGCVIASPVVVKGRGEDGARVCGKAWPLPTLPLDVVGLGWGAVLGCRACEGEHVEVCPMSSPMSQIPVAGKVTIVPRTKLDFPVDSTFTSYVLHMHDGSLLTLNSYLGVQFLGEKRVFKVVAIEESRSDPTPSPIVELRQDLSKLNLNGYTTSQDHSVSSVFQDRSASPSPPDSTEVDIYKVTGRSKFEVVEEYFDDGGEEGSGKISQHHPLSFVDVGGLEKQKQLLKELVLHPLRSLTKTGVVFPHGIILYGPAGVGKSLLAQALIGESSSHSVRLSAAQLLTQESDSVLREAFSEARENCPSLIILDDLDVLCPQGDSGSGEMERRAIACLLTQLDDLYMRPPSRHVTVMATTSHIDKVIPHLRRAGRFGKEVEIPVPSSGERLQILVALLQRRTHTLSQEELKSVAERAHGYVGADLNAVCAEAQYKALHGVLERAGEQAGGQEGKWAGGQDEKVRITLEDMFSALREVRPSAMKEVTLEVPKVLWSDIGGQEEVKQSMREAVERPITHPEAYAKMGIKPPRGVLLYGPPGCSKTMVARALATESGLNFMAVKGPELFSKWVGDSERAVRQVFRRARAAAPAIIFFDEIDALAVERKSEGSSVADRVLAQLLTEIDGVESLGDVLVVAATNRPDMIDKALIRPGRIDELIYVPLPSDVTRREILKIQFRQIPVDKDVTESVESLVVRTGGFSGAEVVSLCQKAALSALREDVECCSVHWRHFEEALKNMFPQTSAETIKYYEEFKKKQKNIFK